MVYKGGVTTKANLAVISINNVDPGVRNRFRALCALRGMTMKDAVLQLMQTAIDADTLDLIPSRQ